jgi:hypothetical protein
MALTYGKSSPHDILIKVERDQSNLESAEAKEDVDGMSDALFNLAVGLTSLKDWLKKEPSASFTPAGVENHWKSSVALSSFRDIANGGKHRVITKYVPATSDVLTSAWTEPLTLLETLAKAVKCGKKYPRLKVVCTDGSRHRAVELGRTAISECQKFLKDHGVA